MDELFSSDFLNGNLHEEFDDEIFKLMENLEMQATMNSVKTKKALGQLDSDGKNFIATFTEEGSSAIASMSYTNDSLYVTFRKSMQNTYQYMVSEEVRSVLYKEVIDTLVDGEGSVGRKVQNLIATNQIHLV
jgi:hypothetical protein